jgi:sigma-B regulation protein RsbU (phosphoserine phosphatase)
MTKPGLRGKFLVGLLIATALPLVIGLVVLETWGYRHLMNERGRLHQMEAMTLVRAIHQAGDAQGEQFRTWIAADPAIVDFVQAKNRELETRDPAEVAAETRRLDGKWESLIPEAPVMKEILANSASESLIRYQTLHPETAEALVTDSAGRLVAATGKTTDYDQADETWWRKGEMLTERSFWIDALQYDSSSNVFALDVVAPLYRENVLAGVAKLSVDVSSLFTRLGFDGEALGERWEIVLPDGRILASSKSGYVSLRDRMAPESLEWMRRNGQAGTLDRMIDGDSSMSGYVTVGEPGENLRGYVLFSSRRSDVVTPLRRRLILVGVISGLTVLGCGLAGFVFVNREVLKPLQMLGKAARSVAETATLTPERDEVKALARRRKAEDFLQRILAIHTGDEVQDLAGDLAVMTDRVLRYHRELEMEVAAKTSVIRQDLEMAREFQNALLPSDYPIPSPKTHNPLSLRFAHFYQPATTVGGDFFDLFELDENRVGVLIADVMGHGARSALVTAILRALVRHHSEQAADPGEFLGELNRHLHEVISRSGQTLFVTAFFMTLDTRDGVIAWSVAGHPAPLWVRRGSGRAPEPLQAEGRRQPALGLLPDVIYRTHESPLKPGEVFLLFTDGVIEAERPDGQPFGLNRLVASFDEALDGPMAAMPAKIVGQVSAFQKRAQYDDDVCIVAVEVAANYAPKPSPLPG